MTEEGKMRRKVRVLLDAGILGYTDDRPKGRPPWVRDERGARAWRAATRAPPEKRTDSFGSLLSCDGCGDNLHWRIALFLSTVPDERMDPATAMLCEMCRAIGCLFQTLYGQTVKKIPDGSRAKYKGYLSTLIADFRVATGGVCSSGCRESLALRTRNAAFGQGCPSVRPFGGASLAL